MSARCPFQKLSVHCVVQAQFTFQGTQSGLSHMEGIHSSDGYLDSRLLYLQISHHAAQTVLKPVDVDM